MLFRSLFVSVVAATVVNASFHKHLAHTLSSRSSPADTFSLLSRQTPDFDIPEGCEGQCDGLVDLYNSCESGNQQECRRICEQDTYETFINCAQCEIDTNGYTYSEEDATQFENAMRQFPTLCRRLGMSVNYVPLNLTTSDNPTMPSNAAVPHTLPTLRGGLIGAVVAITGVVGGAALLA